MINDFLIRAYPSRNELYICLDGYFMKSELELALQLAKSESRKLLPGFKIVLDILNLRSSLFKSKTDYKKIERLLKMMGGGIVSVSGQKYTNRNLHSQSVGFYPHENTWFL